MKRAIITYFEPFGGRKINTSEEVAKALSDSFETFGLPVSWKRSLPILNTVIEKDPRFIFMLGEAGSYQDVTVELIARNICSGTDEDGEKKDNERILRVTPKEIKTNFNLEGLELTSSNNAGRFLCNYAYYIALLRAEVTKVIFIHIPYFHPKGNRKKELIIQKVKDIIYSLIENEKDYLIRLNGKVTRVTEDNALELYPKIKKIYDLPNIIIGIERKEDGSFVMSGRADKYKGVWYVDGSNKEEEEIAKKMLYYRISRLQEGIDVADRENGTYNELTYRFETPEYDGAERLVKRYINLFISRAEYTNELDFYISLDRIRENLLKSVLDVDEVDAIDSAKEYVSRLGLKRTKEILLKEVKK